MASVTALMLFSFSLHANSLSLNCKPSVYRVCCETCHLVYKVAILSEVEERAELVCQNKSVLCFL